MTVEITPADDCEGSMVVLNGANAPLEDRGGLVYMTGGSLFLKRVHVTAFQGSTRGGAIALRGSGNATLQIDNCEFSECEASWYGGAIYGTDNSSHVVS